MENIRVALRMRPINKREIDAGDQYGWKISGGNTISLLPNFQQELIGKKKISQSTKMTFNFDACFSDTDDNWLVYEKVVRDVATSSLEGINGTIFMYGSTGCGKTFTMMGLRELTDGSKNIPKALEDSSDSGSEEEVQQTGIKSEKSTQGILISSLKEVFKEAEEDERRVFFKCSYIEIYNDNVHDLLCKNKDKLGEPLKIVEDAQRGEFIIQNLTEDTVTNLNEVLDILKKGELNRHFAATAMNHNSSRSHTIFRLCVKTIENKLVGQSRQEHSMKKRNTRRQSLNLESLAMLAQNLEKLNQGKVETETTVGKDSIITESVMNFVDLAGSEKASIHVDDGRQKEGQHINRSLFFLTQVISMKADKKNDAHIPYRNSPLTKILKTSLGGNSRTLVILAMTPVYSQFENSMSTLRFGQSAKKIENKISANMTMKGDDEAVKMVIAEYEKKIKDLQDQISDERAKRVQFEDEARQLEQEKRMILQQLSDGGESLVRQFNSDQNQSGGMMMQNMGGISMANMVGMVGGITTDGQHFVRAYKLAKKELGYMKSKLKYLEENIAEVVKRHIETYSLLMDVSNKKKIYKTKYEQSRRNSKGDEDSDGSNEDEADNSTEISDDEKIMKDFIDSIAPSQVVEEEDNTGRKKKKKRKIFISDNQDLKMLERDIKNKYGKKRDQLMSFEEENIQNMLRLNIQECDKKIFNLEDEIIELEDKHLNDILADLEEKKRQQEEQEQEQAQENAAKPEEGEEHNSGGGGSGSGTPKSGGGESPKAVEQPPPEDDIFSSSILPTQPITFGRVRIQDIHKQIEQDSKQEFEGKKSVQISNIPIFEKSQTSGPQKPILKQPKLSVLIKQDFEVNKGKMYEYNGVYMTLEEIDRLKKSDELEPIVEECLQDLYRDVLSAIKFLDADPQKQQNNDPLSMKRGSAVVRYSIKPTQQDYKEVNIIDEDDDDDEKEHQDDQDALRRKAEQKVKDFSNKQASPYGTMGFKNKLAEKAESMSSRENSPEPREQETIRKQLFQTSATQPLSQNIRSQKALEIIAQSQKLLETLQSGGRLKQVAQTSDRKDIQHNQPDLRSENRPRGQSHYDFQQAQRETENETRRPSEYREDHIKPPEPSRNNSQDQIAKTIYTNVQYFQHNTSQKKSSRKMEGAPPQNEPPRFSTPSYKIKAPDDPASIIQYADGYQIPNKYTPPQYKRLNKF